MASDHGAKMLGSRVPPCLYRCALLYQAYGPQPRQATALVRKIPVSPFTLGDPGAHMVVGHGIKIPWLTYLGSKLLHGVGAPGFNAAGLAKSA